MFISLVTPVHAECGNSIISNSDVHHTLVADEKLLIESATAREEITLVQENDKTVIKIKNLETSEENYLEFDIANNRVYSSITN